MAQHYTNYTVSFLSDETDNYKLFLRGPATGTLGDSMLNTGISYYNLSGMYFSTPDRDNDRASGNCADDWRGGWWFNVCHRAFLNDPWSTADWYWPWSPTVEWGTNVRGTLMLIKRH